VRNKTIFCLLVVLLMAIPADSQYGNVYFSLSTNKLFCRAKRSIASLCQRRGCVGVPRL